MWQAATPSAESAFSFDPIDLVAQYGVLGLVLALIVLGYLVAKPSVQTIIADRDAWKAAFELERTAHQETRNALVQANKTSEVALESSQTVAKMLDYLGHRTEQPRSAGG